MRAQHRGRKAYMAKVVAVGVAAVATGGLLAAGVGGLSEAEARTSYCSPSGDYCYGIERPRRSVILRIESSMDFGPVTACVIAARGTRRCARFGLLSAGWGYMRRVRVDFPKRSRGRFKVAWWSRWGPLGPRLSLRR